MAWATKWRPPGDGESFMRVLVGTGEYLMLELVPDVRNNGNVPNWEFRPPVDGEHGHMQDFGSYGVYKVYISYGAFGHTCLVNFDKASVSITAIHEPVVQGDGPLTIEEFTQPATVTLTAGKRARTGQ